MAASPTSPRTSRHHFAADFPDLYECHLYQLVEDSGIASEIVRARGPWTVTNPNQLDGYGFRFGQVERTPGIFFPFWTVDGRQVSGCYRPDTPRIVGSKPGKYENPAGVPLVIDCPPSCRAHIDNPTVPLWITEGVKKADALATHGHCAIALPGVWGFKATNDKGGIAMQADLDYIAWNGRRVYLCFDSDAAEKASVYQALARMLEHIRRKKAEVRVIHLPAAPDGAKQGVDDFLRAGGPAALQALMEQAGSEPRVPASIVALADALPRIERPLALLPDGAAVAVTWLDVRREQRSERARDGAMVALNPPRISHKREPHAVVLRGRDASRWWETPAGSVCETTARITETHVYGAGGDKPWHELSRIADVAIEYTPPPVSCWSRQSLTSFNTPAAPWLSPALVFERVVAVLEHFLDFEGADVPERNLAEMVALWIMHTYFTPAFPVCSYLLAHGVKGCGKTQLLTIVARLSYLGRLFQAAATSASTRVLAAAGATLCFDDLENVSERSFDPDKRAILLASNRRGVTHLLMEQTPAGWRPREYHLYCPKAFSSIQGFDDVLGSRTITAPLMRTDDPVRARRDPADDAAWPEPPAALVDALWTTALTSLSLVAALPPIEPAGVFGRRLEPWRPLLAIARLLAADGSLAVAERLEETMRALTVEQQDREEQTVEMLLLRGLLARVAADDEVVLTPADLADAVAAECQRADGNPDGPTLVTRATIGRAMVRLRAGTRLRRHTGRSWRVNGHRLRRLARAYGLSGDSGVTA